MDKTETTMTSQPFYAHLAPLQGKHYGTLINFKDETGHEYEITVWTGDPEYKISDRELETTNFSTREEARADGFPCDCHYESERDYLLAQAIVDTINNFRLPV